MNAVEKIVNDKNSITKESYMAVIEPLLALAISRNQKYGNSIAIIDDSSIVDLVLMKLCRTKTMIKESDSQGIVADKKMYDEIGDSINYLVYLLARQNEKWEMTDNE